MSAPETTNAWWTRYRGPEEIAIAGRYNAQLREQNGLPPAPNPFTARTGQRRRRKKSGHRRDPNRVHFDVFEDDTSPQAPDFHYHLDNAGQSSTQPLISRPAKRRRVRLEDLDADFTTLDFGAAVSDTTSARDAPLQDHGQPEELLDGAGDVLDDVIAGHTVILSKKQWLVPVRPFANKLDINTQIPCPGICQML